MIERTRKSGSPSFEEISRRAYEIFVQRGRPNGQDLEHWLQAENELKAASTGRLRATTGRTLRGNDTGRKRTAVSVRKPARVGRGRRTDNS